MKRYRFLFLLLAALSMTSCLDEHPKDQLDEDAIYGSASDIYINAVASLYNYIGGANESEGIQGTCRGIYDYNTLTTDEAMIPIRGGDWYDGGLWNAMYQHRWSADDQSLANPDGSDVEATLDFATREYTIIKQVAAPGKGKMSYLLH